MLALAAFIVPATAEQTVPLTIKYGVLSMLNVSEDKIINLKGLRPFHTFLEFVNSLGPGYSSRLFFF